MAKLKTEPVLQRDLIEFIESQSDFAFELIVLNQLVSKQFECEHGGSYEDSISGKLRQFDLRAYRYLGARRLRLAVECKQVGGNFPLLVFRVPRTFEESKHHVLLSVDPKRYSVFTEPSNTTSEMCARTIEVQGRASVYNKTEPVGKSVAQVGRDTNGLLGSDGDMYSKWTQAIGSARDLVTIAASDGFKDGDGWLVTFVMPIVVVPDGRLWAVDYDNKGNRTSDPQQVDRCPFLINIACEVGAKMSGRGYLLSHFEFVTLAGLDQLIDDVTNEHMSKQYFAEREVQHHCTSK